MKNTFTLAHVGVNTENAEEALALVELLAGMFNLAPRHGQKSEFAGPYFECMKAPFHGKNGHIAMQTPDLESAVAELKEKGFSFREETAAYDDAGKLKNIYLAGEYGGFAIHILWGCILAVLTICILCVAQKLFSVDEVINEMFKALAESWSAAGGFEAALLCLTVENY